jgi:hypothetical protein
VCGGVFVLVFVCVGVFHCAGSYEFGAVIVGGV